MLFDQVYSMSSFEVNTATYQTKLLPLTFPVLELHSRQIGFPDNYQHSQVYIATTENVLNHLNDCTSYNPVMFIA